MNKKGISGVVAVVLIILIVILAVVIVWNVVNSAIKKSNEETEETMSCLKDVSLSIVSSCYSTTSNQIRFTIKNNNGMEYDSDFLKLQIAKNGQNLDIPTTLFPKLGPLEKKEFVANVNNPENIEEAIFIPMVKESEGYELNWTVDNSLVQ